MTENGYISFGNEETILKLSNGVGCTTAFILKALNQIILPVNYMVHIAIKLFLKDIKTKGQLNEKKNRAHRKD